MSKYAKLAGLDDLPLLENPQIFLPPYFLCEKVGDQWYQHTATCLNYALATIDAQ